MKRKLSFTTMGTPQLDHAGAIDLALEIGFDGVDIRCADFLGEVRPDSGEVWFRDERVDIDGQSHREELLPGVHRFELLPEASMRFGWVGGGEGPGCTAPVLSQPVERTPDGRLHGVRGRPGEDRRGQGGPRRVGKLVGKGAAEGLP